MDGKSLVKIYNTFLNKLFLLQSIFLLLWIHGAAFVNNVKYG